jgi:SAM-dependent methyltransferase
VSRVRLRDRYLAGLAEQLGRPEGLRGRLVGRSLNRVNRSVVVAAVEATALQPGQAGADLGFGGGLGLRTMLGRVGPTGHVTGVEISSTMLDRARRAHRSEIAAGRLDVQQGSLAELPLGDASIDGLITVNTLYFVDDLGPVYRELARVVRPSGRAVVGVADAAAMAQLPFTVHGFRLRPAAELEAGLAAAGFDVRDQRVGEGSDAFHLLVCSRS